MGKDSKDKPYKGKIRHVLDNEKKAHQDATWWNSNIYVYCGGDEDIQGHKKGTICKKKRGGKYVYPFASSWVDRGWWNDYYIVLCPRLFAEKDSLFHTIAQMGQGMIDKTTASSYKFTWGHTYYHELMHLDPLVSPKETWDPAYGACKVADLAKKSGCQEKLYPKPRSEKWSSLLNGRQSFQ